MGDKAGGCCLWLLKTLSVMFWGCGAFMAYAGIVLILMYKHYQCFFEDVYITLPGSVAIAVAGFLILTGVMGLCIPPKDSRCQQGTFMYCLIIVLCLEASAAVLGLVFSHRLEYELSPMENIFSRYNGSSSDPGSRAVDALQKQLRCCGVHNYTDWDDLSWHPHTSNASVPESCCIKSNSNCTGNVLEPEFLYQQGCQPALSHEVERFLAYVCWCAVAAIALELLSAVSDCVLMGRQSLQDYRILDSETFA